MTRAAWAIAVGVMLAVGVGCHRPRTYAPNYGTYPPYPVVPSGAVPGGTYPAAPGGSYIVPGQTVPGAVPGTLGPATPSYPANGPTIAPPLNSGGGNAPPATYEGGANPVPDYRDPTTGDFGTTPSGDGFQPPAQETPYMDGGAAIPSPNGYAAAPPTAGPPDYFAGLSEYELNRPEGPSSSPSASGVSRAGYEQAVDETFEAARPEPLAAPQQSGGAANSDWYGYDHNGYRWLRGVVNYDPRCDEWFIMYGLPPEKGERFGGALTLAPHPKLQDLRNNDVVQVRGRVDPSAGQDIQGKPYYRIEELTLLGRYE